MKKLGVILTIAMIVAGAYAQIQQEQPFIFHFTLVSDQFCTGGQPKLEALEKLKSEGVKSIINLRTPGEHRAAEKGRAEARALLVHERSDPHRARGREPFLAQR